MTRRFFVLKCPSCADSHLLIDPTPEFLAGASLQGLMPQIQEASRWAVKHNNECNASLWELTKTKDETFV